MSVRTTTTWTCDRCGAERECAPDMVTPSTGLPNGWLNRDGRDLCTNCADSYLRWWDSPSFKALSTSRRTMSAPEPDDEERKLASEFFRGLDEKVNWTEELAKLLARHRDSVETACICPGPHG